MPITLSPEKQNITFANGTHIKTHHVTDLAPGITATVLPEEHCPNNLLPINTFLDSDCTATFTKDHCIITPDHQPDKQAPLHLTRDPETGLFLIDLSTAQDFLANLQSASPRQANSATLAHQTSLTSQVHNLHERMGHPPCETMCAAVSGPDPAWKNTNLTAQQIRSVFKNNICLTCAATKRNLDGPTDRSHEERKQWKPGECISCDPAVKINPKGFDGSDCFFLFKDVATGYLHAIITDSKSSSCFIDACKEVLAFYAKYKGITTTLRTDSESIFLSAETKEFLTSRHIDLQTSAPERHFQVSVERDMQTVFKNIAAMLHGQPFLRLDLWPLALLEYIQRKNRTPNARSHPQSPHQKITGDAANLSNQYSFTFGDVVIVGTPARQRDKLDPRNEVGIYIGQEIGTVDTHRIFFPHNHTIRIRGSVSKIEPTPEQLNKWIARRINSTEPVYKCIEDAYHDLLNPASIEAADPDNTTSLASNEENALSPSQDHTASNPLHEPQQTTPAAGISDSCPDVTPNRIITSPTPIPSSHPMQTPVPQFSITDEVDSILQDPNLLSSLLHYIKRTRKKKHRPEATSSSTHAMTTRSAKHIFANVAVKVKEDNDTPTVKKALLMQDHQKWRAAIRAEIFALLAGTLTPIDIRQLQGIKYTVIETTMQLKRKRNAKTGEVEKHKARECVRGDLISDQDADDTYSPTINQLTFVLILQIAIIKGLRKRTIDTVGAFLYQDYPEQKPPLVLQLNDTIAEICDLPKGQFYRLDKYLYGLPDASRAYYEAYSRHLIANGYKKSTFDPCLFTRITDTETTYICIHVDDTFIFSNDDAHIDRFIETLRQKFQLTVNEEADTYLGVHLHEDPVTGAIKLHQKKLIDNLLSTYQDQLRNPPTTVTDKEYQKLLGMLMYLIKSRPDIQAEVSFAATHAKNPSVNDYLQLLDIVKYIDRTKDKGLILTAQPHQDDSGLQLYCHVDASYLSHEDSKSHTGYTLSFGRIGCFFSKSSKQSLVSTSSTHAEARALYALLQDIIYIVTLCNDLQIKLKFPIQIYEDNFPVIQLTTHLAPKAKKCKHFIMLLNFIQEYVDNGLIRIDHIDTNDNLADILTKLLHGKERKRKASLLLNEPQDESAYQDDNQSKHQRINKSDQSDN